MRTCCTIPMVRMWVHLCSVIIHLRQQGVREPGGMLVYKDINQSCPFPTRTDPGASRHTAMAASTTLPSKRARMLPQLSVQVTPHARARPRRPWNGPRPPPRFLGRGLPSKTLAASRAHPRPQTQPRRVWPLAGGLHTCRRIGLQTLEQPLLQTLEQPQLQTLKEAAIQGEIRLDTLEQTGFQTLGQARVQTLMEAA
jgi:hypothetical protein